MKFYHVLIIGFSLAVGVNCVVDHKDYVVPFGKNGASFISETSSVDYKPGGFSKSVSFSTHSQDGGSGPGPIIDNNFYGNGLPRFRFPNNFRHNLGYNRFNSGYFNFPSFDTDFDGDFFADDDFLGPEFDSFVSPLFRNRFQPFPSNFAAPLVRSRGMYKNPFYNQPGFNIPFLPRRPALPNQFGYGYNNGGLFNNVGGYGGNSGVVSPYDMFGPFRG